MTEAQNPKRYDLEERTECFARDVRSLVKQLPKSIANAEDSRQVIRASGSVGANYIEANEALGKKDFLMKIRTCRKEAKEGGYWLRLLDIGDDGVGRRRDALVGEAKELTCIFGAILRKSE